VLYLIYSWYAVEKSLVLVTYGCRLSCSDCRL
jgi:hypothetical protein